MFHKPKTMFHRLTKQSSNTQGFSIVELLIVVAIVGILAAIATPQFERLSLKSKRAEAYLGIKKIYKAEISFYANADYYTPSMRQLGIEMNGAPSQSNGNCIEGLGVACGSYYSFHIPYANPLGFEIAAQGWPDPHAIGQGSRDGADLIILFYP